MDTVGTVKIEFWAVVLGAYRCNLKFGKCRNGYDVEAFKTQ